MLAVREPSAARLEAVLQDQVGRPFSYTDVGATGEALPNGYRHARHSVDLGYGTAVFDRASEGLRRWQAHRLSGVTVHPPDAALEEGATVVLAVPVAVVWVTAACRIVYVTEEASRFAFAYGTLPHHVVKGEESFVVERDDLGVVRLVISAFLRVRPRTLRPAGRVVHRMDERLVGGYLDGLRAYLAQHP